MNLLLLNQIKKKKKVYRFGFLNIVLLILTLMVLYPAMADALDLTLSWDKNTDTDLAGYRVFMREGNQDYNYSQPVYEGTQIYCTVSNLEYNTAYYFVARAFDKFGNESENSNEVSYNVVDSDNDEINDDDEVKIYQTNPNVSDTDSDGIDDGDELFYWGDDWDRDTDGDGLINLLDKDADGDGVFDGDEIQQGTDPLDDGSMPAVMIYEDAEDGNTSGWAAYDNDPYGATISNVYDADRQSRVIELQGAGIANACDLRKADRGPWRDLNHFIIEFSMKFAENFTIYIQLHTSQGLRYLKYVPQSSDSLGTGTYATFGLGTNTKDGQWHTIVRNLEADLETAQPGNRLLEVNSFLVRGSGSIDDVKLRLDETLYENAEDGGTGGWDVYDNNPSGASITNVFDSDCQSRVIELNGAGLANGYRLRTENNSNWQNTSQFAIQWKMKFLQEYKVYVKVRTEQGTRYLKYIPEDYDNFGDEYIAYGLGTDTKDGNWYTIVRDLEADLEAAQPGNRLLEVYYFLIRGSGRVDDIKLM